MIDLSQTGVLRTWKEHFRLALHVFEIQILAFPLLVVFLACTSFFFGGHCAAWQWWMTVIPVLVVPLVRRRWQVALSADILFVCVLLFFWCLAPWMLDEAQYTDNMKYHLPTIRLLVLGWNPVLDPQAFGILERLGLEPDGQAWVSVAYLAKTAGVFNACASFFVCDPLAITFPIIVFLSVGTLFSAIRCSSRHPLLGVLAALALLRWALVTTYVDEALAIASGGLLFAMCASLERGKILPLQLAAFTFWMVNCKLSGCAAALAFWSVFAVAFAVKYGIRESLQAARTCALTAVCVFLASSVVSFNPYGTSLRDSGHPLYPLTTIDEARFPRMNIPADCKIGNDDWRRMDYWGNWFNSYTSPKLVRAWYNRKLGRKDFSPHQYIWDYSWPGSGKLSPLPHKSRIAIWASFLALLAFRKWRFFALSLILGLSVFPKQYMGYLRYYPWLAAFESCALLAVLEWIAQCRSWNPFLRRASFAAAVLSILFPMALHRLFDFRDKTRELGVNRPEVTTSYGTKKWMVPDTFDLEGKPLYPEGKAHMNNAILLMRAIGRPNTEVRFRPAGEIDDLVKTRFGYYIDSSDADTLKSFKTNNPCSTLGKVRRYAKCLMEIFFRDYPNALRRQLDGGTQRKMPPSRIRSLQPLQLHNAISSPARSGNIGEAMPSSKDFKSSIACLSSVFCISHSSTHSLR